MKKGLLDKINRLEAKGQDYYDAYGDSKLGERMPLYHGILFDRINTLEGIFYYKKVYAGNYMPNYFESIDGKPKAIYQRKYSDNANMGEYVSVLPFDLSSPEFKIFIRENIHFVFNGNLPALKTHYLRYEEYLEFMNSGMDVNCLYSYANEECLVPKEISLDYLMRLEIDSRMCMISKEEIDYIFKLMRIYNINVPFVDMNGNKVLYDPVKDKNKGYL